MTTTPVAAHRDAPTGGSGSNPRARTRLYRDGKCLLHDFPVADISEHLTDPASVVWLDLCRPTAADFDMINEEFGLHELAVEDAVGESQRPKLDRYATHLFLSAYAVTLDAESTRLDVSEIAVFITDQALITVRKDDRFDITPVLARWDASPDLAGHGVGFLLYGLLDHLVDGHFTAVQQLDEGIEQLEDLLFDERRAQIQAVQRRSFQLRKNLVVLRRVVLPMREVLNTLLPVQANRMNLIMKKVTSWAAIIAVPTAITGFYGQNLPYPGYASHWGFAASTALIAALSALLYLAFKRKDWL